MKKKSILICEDDEGIIDIAEIVLTEMGYSVITLLDSDDIYSIIEAKRPDLVLLDLWLSGASGEEITRTLKTDPAKNQIPIIIMSANKDGPAIAEKAGANAFLKKPFDLAALEKIVEQHI